MISLFRQIANRPQARRRTESPDSFTPFNPKVRWWNEDSWISRFKRHIERDARPDKGFDWRRLMDRRFTLQQFAQSSASLRGSTAECGVYTGVTSAIICESLKHTYNADEFHYGFDSFAGLPAPGPNDGAWKEGHLASPLEVAARHVAEFKFCKLITGWIPDSLECVAGRPFRLVHIDLDLAEPTLQALEFFYPRVIPFGVLVFDDYGFHSCPGARDAVDQFLADKPERIIELVTGQAVLFKQ